MAWTPPAIGARGRGRGRSRPRTSSATRLITGDRNPLHFDPDFAARTRPGALIVHGGLTTGLFNALVAEVLPGPGSVFLHQEWDYPAPVYIGDTVTAEAEVIEARADKPITTLRCVARREDGTEVLRGTCVVYTSPTDRPLPRVGRLEDEPAARWRQLASWRFGMVRARCRRRSPRRRSPRSCAKSGGRDRSDCRS